MRNHIVITGTGRTGTSYLVQLLTFLGLDTGFTTYEAETKLDKNARAGLEHDIRNPTSPHIVKSPWFCDIASQVLNTPSIRIEHVFSPMRDLFSAAESRRRVAKDSDESTSLRPSQIRGGLWHTDSFEEQESILLNQLYKLALALSDSNVPITLMNFPRMTQDTEYLFQKLEPIVRHIPFSTFKHAHVRVTRPDWVHTFQKDIKRDQK